MDEHLASAEVVDDLELHAVSFSVGDMKPATTSASSNGFTGLVNHASAPDHLASHRSWGRSSKITMRPSNGGTAPVRSLASANAPAREAISSATTTSGRGSLQARAIPETPSADSRNSTSCSSPRILRTPPTASAMVSRTAGSAETSRTLTPSRLYRYATNGPRSAVPTDPLPGRDGTRKEMT